MTKLEYGDDGRIIAIDVGKGKRADSADGYNWWVTPDTVKGATTSEAGELGARLGLTLDEVQGTFTARRDGSVVWQPAGSELRSSADPARKCR